MSFIALILNFAKNYDLPEPINNNYNSPDFKYKPYIILNAKENFCPNENIQRKHHDKNNTNKPTRICLKGLEERIKNKKLKEEMAEEERKIQEVLSSKKIKSRRWAKRHHDYILVPDRYFPQKHLFIRRNRIV